MANLSRERFEVFALFVPPFAKTKPRSQSAPAATDR